MRRALDRNDGAGFALELYSFESPAILTLAYLPYVSIWDCPKASVGRSMKVLAYIHTFNDTDIHQANHITALLRQEPRSRSMSLLSIMLQGTAASTSLAFVMRRSSRTPRFRTSRGVATGLDYRLDRDFDWVWILDPNSPPGPDTSRKCSTFYAGSPDASTSPSGVSSVPTSYEMARQRSSQLHVARTRSRQADSRKNCCACDDAW